jgi:hypothetical protein
MELKKFLILRRLRSRRLEEPAPGESGGRTALFQRDWIVAGARNPGVESLRLARTGGR